MDNTANVTMQFLRDDRILLRASLIEALSRRKQLTEFPLTLDEIIDVQFNPEVAARVRYIQAEHADVLNWDNSTTLVIVTSEHPMGSVKIKLRTSELIPTADHWKTPNSVRRRPSGQGIICYPDSPQTAKLLAWAWKATLIQAENTWISNKIGAALARATTHQQVHRYIPELYTLLCNQEKNTNSAPFRKGNRIIRVAQTLERIGSARANQIPYHSLSPRERLRIKAVFAQCLILPAHNGLKKDSDFDATWVDL